MRRLFALYSTFCILQLVSFISICFAEPNWQSIGPFVGNITTIAIDPTNSQTLYAGTSFRLFKSTNGGALWTLADSGMTDSNVTSLAIDPTNGQTLYATTGTKGVFKSNDGGASWAPINNGITADSSGVITGSAIAVDQTDRQTVYAGISSGFRGLYKTTDGGASWTEVNSGMTFVNQGFKDHGKTFVYTINALAIDPANGQTVYAATQGGVFKTADGGSTWTLISSTITSEVIPTRGAITYITASAYSIVIDPSNSQTLYASVDGQIYKSINGGTTWSETLSGATPSSALTIDPTNNQTVYIGTFLGVSKTSNAGDSWSAASNGMANQPLALAVDPMNSRTLYAGTSAGIFKTTNGGASWAAANVGFSNFNVVCLALDPTNNQTLYVGTKSGGLLKSTRGGSSWTLANSGIPNSDVTALAIDRSNGQILYAVASGQGIFKSVDGGASWTQANNGMSVLDVTSLAIDPTDSHNLYAGTWTGGIFTSTDAGASWTASNTGLATAGLAVLSLAVDPAHGGTLFAAAFTNGVLKTTDGAKTWSSTSLGANNTVYTIAIDPTDSQTIYAGTFGGIFKSSDGGSTWNAANSGITDNDFTSIAVDPAYNQTVYAATAIIMSNAQPRSSTGATAPAPPAVGSVFKSDDGGKSWQAAIKGMAVTNVNALVVDPTNSQTVYAGTTSGGLYKAVSTSFPTISSTASVAYFSSLTPGSFKVSASGWPAPQFDVSGQLPPGISFDPATGILSGIPTGGAGSYPLLVTASNGLPPDSVRALTVTVLQASSLVAAITPPKQGFASISGTASGSGLTRVEVLITDGTYFLSADGTFSPAPVWLAASGTSSWVLNTSAASWREGVAYTVLARAVNDSTSSVPTSTTFSLQVPAGKSGTKLTLSFIPGTLRAGDGTSISGSLVRADASGASRQLVTLLITPPATAATAHPTPMVATLSTDSSGNFTSGMLSQFAIPGVYMIQARFEGTATLAASFASQVLGVTPQSGYAIIVVGEASDHSLLGEHTATADGIYFTLINKRGFLPANIVYLKSSASAPVTKQQIQMALGQMQVNLAAVPAPFYLFMIDHGSQNGFVLGDTTSNLTLAPAELATWLNDFEAGVSSDTLASYPRFVIVGSCYSGAFVSQLSKPGRIMITSAGADEQSLAGFSIYNSATSTTFSGGEYFIDNMINFLGRGDSFKDAVVQASSNVALRDPRKATLALHSGVYDKLAQHPLLDDNGDATASYLPLSITDGILAANLSLGVGVKSLGEPADIAAVTSTTILPATQTDDVPLWLQVNDNSRIARAWMEIRTPVTSVSSYGGTGQFIPHLITQPLYYDGLQWNSSYTFPNAGTYNLLYYTQDNQTGDISPTAHSVVYKQLANNTAPSAFSLTAPEDAGSVSPMFPLSWQEVTSIHAVTYTLLVATDLDFTNIVYRQESIPQAAMYMPNAALKDPTSTTGGYYCQNGDTHCYWKVQAIDSFGAVTESNTRSFTIVVASNDLPGIIYGYVLDSVTGAPIPGATVFFNNTADTTSLSNGTYFTIKNPGSYSVTIAKAGYGNQSGSLVVSAGKVTRGDFSLSPPTVSFNSNGGSDVSSQSVGYHTTATTPMAPTKIGYSFAGWYSDGSLTSIFAFSTAITADITLYAKWTSLPTYGVTYYGNGSTGGTVPIDVAAYQSSATVTVLGNTGVLTKTGYTFAGWNSAANGTGANYDSAATITIGSDNVTLYAAWVALPTYPVTPSAGDNGSILPSAVQTVSSGATTSFTVTPASGYQIASVTGCDGTLAGITYTTSAVTTACTVSASFSAIIVNRQIPGDCNRNGTVTIAEVQNAINMSLGLTDPLACVDLDGNNTVSISEVQQVINSFLGQ